MRFPTILIDPPVPFNTYSGPALPTRRLRQASAASHYELMAWKELHGLRPWLDQVAAPDCALFLWVCNPHIPEMVKLLESWGFAYKTCALVWVKLNPLDRMPFCGLGFWTRANIEQLWLATRGRVQRMAKDVRQVQEMIERPDANALRLPRQRHSEKPEQFQDEIESLVRGPYLELFARRQRSGWTCLGNEMDGLDIRDALTQVAELDTPSAIASCSSIGPTQLALFTGETEGYDYTRH